MLTGRRWQKEREKEGKYGSCVFVFMHENRTMKLVETVLRSGGGEQWRDEFS
jgi:hypothetical protein